MPIIWINFSTASSRAVHDLRDKPEELRKYVSRLVTEAEKTAKLEELFFEVSAHRACALVSGLDNFGAMDAVTDALEADYATKFLTTAHKEEAIKTRRRITAAARPRPKPKPKR